MIAFQPVVRLINHAVAHRVISRRRIQEDNEHKVV